MTIPLAIALAAGPCPGPIALPVGLAIPLETDRAVSSKTSIKGDMIALHTAADVRIDGAIVIPRGTPATGQVAEARAKGALGMSGKLALRPLYLQVGDTIVRLAGTTDAKASVSAGAVMGMIVLTPGMMTGRSATIPAGAPLAAIVERPVTVMAGRCAD